MAIMPLDKPIDEVIEVLRGRLKDPVVERLPGEPPAWTVMGDFHSFDRWEMDLWGGRMQFRVIDARPTNAEAEEVRRETAKWAPQLVGLLTATTTMQVFKQIERVTRTVIIEDGKEVRRTDGAPETAWKDITREFAERGQRDRLMGAEW